MGTVVSSEGTAIAYNRSGDGPPVILVDGALCYRGSGPGWPLAARLARDFTVFAYDRRGRGESEDADSYSIEREIDDLAAIIEQAGGSACVYGYSSGAVLALEAANSGLGIKKLALYEAPLLVDDTAPPQSHDYLPRLNSLLAAERRGAAVRMFLREMTVPAAIIPWMRFAPGWAKVKAAAHTLPYDHTILGDTRSGRPLPTDRWAAVTMPTLVIDAGRSPAWIRNAMRALADVLPNAEYCTLTGQRHTVRPRAIAPVLTEFFTG